MQALGITHANTGNVPDVERDPDRVDKEDAGDQAKFNRLRTWLEHERDRQGENRAEMAIDGDYYDGLQYTEREALELEDRGQAPLVFNETKVQIDWILGAEKRSRVDWRVLPREESDVENASTKEKVLKYVSDVNRVPFMRSQAFAEAAISGLGWLEDSISSDASDDILYSGGETWRNILHDSYHRRPDGRDMRYLFRWRYVDLDIAKALFPTKADELERAALGADQLAADSDEELWYLGSPLRDPLTARSSTIRHVSSTTSVLSARLRVKVYEAWYRDPTEATVLCGGPCHGDLYDPNMRQQAQSIETGHAFTEKRVVLRMRVAFMTDGDLLGDFETPFRHNDFPLTPIYCFRRQRDGLPYGHVRPMRDPQSDLNKRMSKSLFLLSVNQLITEQGAFDEKGEYTLQDAIDNVSNPQGVFVMKDGSKKFEIRRDFAEIRGQQEIISLDRQFLQSASGVTDEMLGRRTNAVSGEAIRARQEQGALSTGGIFDHYRLAISVSGQKALSNAEKFYSLPKVIRLTEAKGKVDWVRINQPELQPDGSVTFINDITATKADFIVDEQNFSATMRQAMFDSLQEMVKGIAQYAPRFAISMLDMIVDLADFPGKEAMVERLQKLIAEERGEATTPEQQAARAAAAELEARGVAAKIAKDEAGADKLDAEADEIRSTLLPGMQAVDLERVPQGQAGAAVAAPGAPQPSMAAAAGGPAAAAIPPAASPPAVVATLPGAPVSAGPGTALVPVPAPALPVATGASGAPPAAPAAAPALDPIPALIELQQGTLAALDAISATMEQAQQTQQAVQEQTKQLREAREEDRKQMALQFGTVASAMDAIAKVVSEPQEPDEVEPKPDQATEALGRVAEALAVRTPEKPRPPRVKTITFNGPDGKPIVARIERSGE